jgi:lysophospholipase L1-like esterase
MPLAVLLIACGGGDDIGDSADLTGIGTSTTAGTPGVPLDPHVDSFVPDSWTPSAPVRVVYLGDSVTAGVGASSNDLAYAELLVEDVATEYDDLDIESIYGALEVVDVSEGGATTGSLISRQLPNLEDAVGATASGETIVVMTIGGNDAQQALNPFADAEAVVATMLANIEEIVLTLQDQFPDGAYIYLANVYEPSDGTGQTGACFFGLNYSDKLPLLDEADQSLRDMGADLGFAALDMRAHFEGHGFNREDANLDTHHADDPSMWFENDCIHPNDRGHHEIRRLFHAAIKGVDLPLEP